MSTDNISSETRRAYKFIDASLLIWDRSFTRDGWWSAMSCLTLLLITNAAISSHLG